MNRAKAGEWWDYTWNPITGCRGPNNDGPCPYCYAKRIAERFAGATAFPNGFAPTWHPERLDQPAKVKKPSTIFVGSMTDMGAPHVARSQMEAVLDEVRACPQHRFLFLTKQPGELYGFDWPRNTWLGVTVDTAQSVERLGDLACQYHLHEDKLFASFEPLLGDVVTDQVRWLEWAIIGAQTGPGAVAPKREWIEELVEILDFYKVPIFMKDNLRRHWDGEWRREFPWRVR